MAYAFTPNAKPLLNVGLQAAFEKE